jgi:type II secretory pathway component PulF
LLLQEKIPVFVGSILSVASEAGFLEETLKVMENYYLEEFRTTVRNLLNLLQPALLIFVGVIVGFVAIAVLFLFINKFPNNFKFKKVVDKFQEN